MFSAIPAPPRAMTLSYNSIRTMIPDKSHAEARREAVACVETHGTVSAG